ncbi:hypothetical protein MTO96_038933 [Rhipicephalus appendiculatus]
MTWSPDLKDEQQFPLIGTQSIQTTQGQNGRPNSRGSTRSRRGCRSKDHFQSRRHSSSRGSSLGEERPGSRLNGQLPGIQFEITDSNPGKTPADTTKGAWA